ncbi:DUF4097 family beta strand repeat protein [candidate division KSB1 bacterium]|nr:DUF4097 family beta strand repeat protein [candidate division KSB1 bacterium]
MKTKIFVLGITLLFCVFNFATAQEIVKDGNNFTTVIEKSYNVSQGGTLEIVNITGDIEVSSWDKNVVEIREEIIMDVYTEEEAEQHVARRNNGYSQNGNVISIRGLNGSESAESNFYIQVPKKYNLDIQTRGGDISVENLNGNVKTATSGGDIEMMHLNGVLELTTMGGDMLFNDISGRLNARTSGGDIELYYIYCEANVNTSGGDIDLSNATQRISLSTSGGDVDAADVEGDLSVNTSGGDIAVANCSGSKISLQTSGGDIEIKNIKGEISASSSGGDISGEQFYARVNVRTSGGDIFLNDVKAAVMANTSGGDIDTEITLKDFSVPHQIDLQTTGGDIDLTLPAKIPATIKAEIRLNNGGFSFRRYDIYSDFPLVKSKPSESGEKILSSHGDINGGGDLINLKTNGGNINIHKAK